MKKMQKTVLLCCLLLPLLSEAQTNTPRVDQRQINQEGRIEQGAASGRLSQQETMRMEKGQQHVENMEARIKSDGTVTRKERSRLHHAQGVQSRHIYREKHDRQHDFNHDGRNDHRRHRG